MEMSRGTQALNLDQSRPDIYRYLLKNPALLSETPFKYEILQPQHIERVVKMFTEAFCNSEPMTRYVDMTYAGFTPFATRVTEKAARDGLSIVALDNDIVTACSLVEDFTDPLAMDFDPDPKFKPIFALLEQISMPFFHGKTLAKNQIAHLFITAVSEDYRRQGLSAQVNLRAMLRAAQKNYSFMCSEMTNYLNERGTMSQIKTQQFLLGSCVYQDFICEGIHPFKQLTGSANAILWELQPETKLAYQIGNEHYQMTLSELRKS